MSKAERVQKQSAGGIKEQASRNDGKSRASTKEADLKMAKKAKTKQGKVKETDYQSQALSKKEKRQLNRMLKESVKEKKEESESEDDNEDEDEGEEKEELDLERLAASESESELESDDDVDSEGSADESNEDEEENAVIDNPSQEEDVPISDVEYDSDADVVPHTKLTINNKAALRDSLARIELPWDKHLFQEHQSVISASKVESEIKDIYDDTQRELAFYKQGLDAVNQARTTLLKLKVPFSRPLDYFAEMVKSDEHMDKLKNKMLVEAANQKASEDAKKQRHLKKFGKQVQVNTLQERAKQKRETLEKIKSLKRKRGANELNNDDEFQIALEEATRDDSNGGNRKRSKPNAKREAKNSKFGFGGKKRGSKRNDSTSSADVSGFSAKKMKGKLPRPGKSKRSRRH